jgi:pyruvate/2-oxoglutarate dehydrogenase complex dihydrolipoamide dehydrogenase (E3) component
VEGAGTQFGEMFEVCSAAAGLSVAILPTADELADERDAQIAAQLAAQLAASRGILLTHYKKVL